MNIYVYEPSFSEVEENIKNAYIRSIIRNDEVDEEFKHNIRRDDIKVNVKWKFRYTANFDYLTVKIKGEYKVSGSYESTNHSSTATVQTDYGKLYIKSDGGISYDKSNTSTTRYFAERHDFIQSYKFEKKSSNNEYLVSYGDLPPAGTVEACSKRKIKSLSEMPDYVDPLMKEIHLKYFDILYYKDSFEDFCAEQKMLENPPFKYKDITYWKVEDVLEHSINSETVIVYPVFSLEVKHKRKKYHVDEININTCKISTYENHTAPRSIGYNKAKKNYIMARTAHVLLFICSFLTTLLFYINIEKTARGWEQAVLVLKLVLETIAAGVCFFLFRNDPLIENNETSYQFSAKLTLVYVAIYFAAFVLIDGIVVLAHFLF